MSITQDGGTPLITAAWKGKCDIILDLLDSGADINAQNNVSHCNLRLEPYPERILGYVSTCIYNMSEGAWNSVTSHVSRDAAATVIQ